MTRAGALQFKRNRDLVAFGTGLRTVPASNVCPARGLARVGAVAGERTSSLRVLRTALKPCIAPRLGPNVFLAGKPRLIAKLHRPWPGGVCLPARANSTLVRRDAETTAAAGAIPSGGDVDAPPSQTGGRLCGPSAALRAVWTRHGQVRGTCPPLAHTRRSRHCIPTASTTITHEKGNFTTIGCVPDCSVIPGNPSTE